MIADDGSNCINAEGGDSEIGGDGDGVVMVRSLSTSASGGRDMVVWGRTVILAPIVTVSGGWWYNRLCSLRWENMLINRYNNSSQPELSAPPPPPLRPHHPHPRHWRHP
ncbi:hypothetical protein Tco_0298136 [Tanacetum coccineum]